MTATLPRPALSVAPGAPVEVARRVELVRRLAAMHARVARGTLRPPVLSALDRLLPRSPLPDVHATLPGGVRLSLDGRGALARIALLCAGYEHRECEVLAGAVRPAGVFVDVGANVGWFSLLVAAHRPGAAVWAVEPMPGTAAALRRTLAESRLSSVLVHQVALSSAPGSADLVATADSAFAHLPASGGSRSAAGRAIPPGAGLVTCSVVTLDQMWTEAGRPRVDAVKVDVEGVEPEVLRGGTALLRRCRPLLVVEAPTPAEVAAVEDVLGPLAYRRVRPPGVLPYNLVFVPEESP